MRPGVYARLAVALGVAVVGGAAPAWSQGLRITGTSTAQYIDLRPVILDSVPVAQTSGDGQLKQTADGRLVECVPGAEYCDYLRPANVVGAVPLIQDLNVSAWGLATGLRAYAQLRFRAAEGDAASFWPNADRTFEALAAYLELDRGRVLARVGRQWKTSGLGFYNFDGGLLDVRPAGWLTLEGYGGRSLIRGLSEPLTSSAISGVEPWAPNEPDWLLGGEVRVRPSAYFSASALYQRDIRSDMAGLYSDRLAVDASLRLRGVGLTGTLQTDLASRTVDDARLRLQLPSLLGFVPSVEARHYEPYFEMWTIWGAFSPVGFDEASASAMWMDPRGLLTVRLSGGWRSYGQVSGGVASLPLRNDGWHVGADGTLRAGPAWTLSGGYSADISFGESRSDQNLSLRRRLGDGYIGVSGMAFQTVDEFQIDKGRVWGASAEAGIQLLPSARLDGSFQVYRNVERYTGGIDWNQLRGLLQMQWAVGSEAGRTRVARGGER